MLVARAYGVGELRVYGSQHSLDEPAYEIKATTSAPEQTTEMLQSLLADRFALKVHREQHQVTQWVLSVAEGGHKLTTLSPPHPVRVPLDGPREGWTHPVKVQLGNLHAYLQNRLGMPVINRTGLSNDYDVILEAPSSNADLMAALTEQLGLKLVQEVGPIDVIVVDQVRWLETEG